MGAFLAHAETCQFHAEKLRAEDEEVLSVFRLARGLDSKGRVLQGKELKQTIAEHERGHVLWQVAAGRMEAPFKRIYLSNRGEDIAGSGKFHDFRRYEGTHPLDLQAGLQIGEFLKPRERSKKFFSAFTLSWGLRTRARKNSCRSITVTPSG